MIVNPRTTYVVELSEADELKPCPFCGGQPDFEHWPPQYAVFCACGASVTDCYLNENIEADAADHLRAARGAIDGWNGRIA
jgi:hypothetical protein